MTEPTPPPRNTTVAAIITGVVALFSLSAVTYLVAVGRDPSQVIALLAAIGAPSLASVASLLFAQRAAKNVDVVRTQTNGTLTDLTARVAQVEEVADGFPAAFQQRSAGTSDELGGRHAVPDGDSFS